jgi:hypothetical protein
LLGHQEDLGEAEVAGTIRSKERDLDEWLPNQVRGSTKSFLFNKS